MLLIKMQGNKHKRHHRLTCTHVSGSKGTSRRNLNHMARHIYVDMNGTFSKFQVLNPAETRLQILRSNIYIS